MSRRGLKITPCVIPTCENSNAGKNKAFVSFSIPKSENIRQQWISFLEMCIPGYIPKATHRICSAHFTRSCFTRDPDICISLGFIETFKPRLLKASVPTIICPVKSENENFEVKSYTATANMPSQTVAMVSSGNGVLFKWLNALDGQKSLGLAKEEIETVGTLRRTPSAENVASTKAAVEEHNFDLELYEESNSADSLEDSGSPELSLKESESDWMPEDNEDDIDDYEDDLTDFESSSADRIEMDERDRLSDPEYNPEDDKDAPKNAKQKQKKPTKRKMKVKCDVCGKMMPSKAHLARHKGTHDRPNFYSCHICNGTFTNNHHLKRHLIIHLEAKPYLCEICARGFTQASNLKTHIRTHTDERPYPCKLCSEKFRNASGLQAHMYNHTGEKPHACEICGKTFVQMSVLMTHLRVHTKEKPFVCKVCSKAFKCKPNFKRHLRTHSSSRF